MFRKLVLQNFDDFGGVVCDEYIQILHLHLSLWQQISNRQKKVVEEKKYIFFHSWWHDKKGRRQTIPKWQQIIQWKFWYFL